MLKLLIGRSGTGKTTRLLQSIGQEQERCVLLVPDPQSHEMERRLCQVAGDEVCLHAEVLTFSRLANRIFQHAGGLGRQELDAGGRLLLMYRAVQSVAGQLGVYSKPSRRPAFLTGLLATMDELKSCCVTPEQLTRAGEQIGGSEGARLRDLGLICGAYTALAAQTALDPRDRLTRAEEKLSGCSWGEGLHLFLDGFIDFTPQQEQLLKRLMARCARVTVALTCDHLQEDEDGMGIFSAARRTAARLIRLAQLEHMEYEVQVLEQPSPARSQAMQALEAQLFGPLSQPSAQSGGDVRLFCAPDARTEVEWAAAQMLELAREHGLRWRDMALSARSWERYDALVDTVFARYGIPVFRSAMSDILQKPVLTLVTAALDTVSGGYSYDDVFRYLKTDLTDLSREERDILENYVLKWELRGSRWTQEDAWALHPGGYGQKWTEETRQQLARLDGLRRKVARPLERLRHNRDKSGRGQAVALYTFLEEIGLSGRLEERTEQLRQRGELTLAEEYRQLWEILCGGLEQCARLLGDTPMELEEFSKLLRLVLGQYSVGTIPVSLDRVSAGEMLRQSGHAAKVLFLLGADDASIPGVGRESGLLSDDDRELLAGVGVELGLRGQDRLYREMTAVYTACTAPDRALYVSWPTQSGGEELRASFLVERLRRVFPDVSVEEEGDGLFRLCAPAAALEQAGMRPAVRRALADLPAWEPSVRRLEQAGSWERGKLSRASVERLYGRHVPMSASRMDKYKSCHFAYFMNYGLKAEPRRTAGFSAPEYGTFVHYVLEQVFQSDDWRAGSDGVDTLRLKALTRQAVERYVNEQLGGLQQQTARFRYLFDRLIRGVERVVDNVAQELAASRFVPMAFELGFGGKNGTMPPVEVTRDGVTVSVTGVVDRVDGWMHEGKLYLRVVDYKTGGKNFDLTEVANGMGLQMLLYLFTLCREGQAVFGQRELVPAGVLYLPAKDVPLTGSRAMDQKERRKQTDKALKRRGLLLDEPEVLAAMEQPGEEGLRFLPLRVSRDGTVSGSGVLASAQRFERLERHVDRVLRDICAELAAGNICADPYWRGADRNACRYCDFAAACHFEENRGGDCYRRLEGVSAEHFWSVLEQQYPCQQEESHEGQE